MPGGDRWGGHTLETRSVRCPGEFIQGIIACNPDQLGALGDTFGLSEPATEAKGESYRARCRVPWGITPVHHSLELEPGRKAPGCDSLQPRRARCPRNLLLDVIA
jgi:hypothetical protein